MRKGGRNSLKSLKPNLEPIGGRRECLDGNRDTLLVPIYMLSRKKSQKISYGFWSACVSLKVCHGAQIVCISVVNMCKHVRAGLTKRLSAVVETHDRQSKKISNLELMMI